MTTPYYIFDKSMFKSILREYQQIGDVYYPIKANDDNFVVDEVIRQSCCFEVDSIEHIKILISKKNVDPNRILYSYPVRENKDIKKAHRLGIKKYVVDSLQEYKCVTSIVNDALFFIRLNVIDMLNLKLKPEQNKWGLSINKTRELIDSIRSEGNNVIGLSFYLFDEIVKNDENILGKLLDLISGNFSGYSLRYLNIGGGITHSDAMRFLNNLEKTKGIIGAEKIIIEPGKHLLNPCIDMVVSVTEIKSVNNKKIIFINSGIYYGLIDVIIKKRKFEIEHFDEEKYLTSEKKDYLVCGSSSDVSDYLGEYQLNKYLEIGDKLIIKSCGAYSSVMQTAFYKKKKIKMCVKEDTI
jgi:diaminopimelate decarboxylase